ncbi:MAG: PD-(D/E)XK nuclease family protein [Patescibacteria group bacterium]|nr:PD-(D/E)XK nuclease family protein [Candidatus Beckwithbacteria bacterium]MDZ4228920.1 PD-(D/E)XK nuclease family protein [Patescibacteria group bacterium]
MVKDKYNALWVSHSSISDWLNCPRAYFLKNVYKDPKTGHKINLMSPPLNLGQAVHEVLEDLSRLPLERRFQGSLLEQFNKIWHPWFDPATELKYKERGREMLKKVEAHPGPLKNLAVKIKMDLPYYWLSESDNIILCGRIDWLEYLPKQNAVHIIDFKTGKGEESQNSLQLKIYYLLVGQTQERPVTKLSYWYLDRNDAPKSQSLPEAKTAELELLKIAKEIKLARKLERFKCPHGGCRYCQPYEDILAGKSKKVGTDSRGNDVYINSFEANANSSEIL